MGTEAGMFNGSSPWMSDALREFQTRIRAFVAAALAPHEARWWEQHHVDRAAWRQAGAAGMLLPSIPACYGGGGGTFAHDAIVTLEQGRALATSLGTAVHSGVVAHYLLRYATEAQKDAWLPRLARGEWVGAIAMSEPGAGSDLQAIRTRAVRQGEHYVVDGAKTFITNGHHADLILLVVKTDPARGARGTSLLVVETEGLAGFRRGRILEKIGQKGLDTTELFFDGARVPVGHLLGPEEGQGFVQLMQQLPQERMIVALGAYAAMERALADTLAYAQATPADTGRVFDQPQVRHTLAECQTLCAVARAFLDDCMVQVLRGELSGAAAAMAKWWCTQHSGQVIDACLQLQSGNGCLPSRPMGRLYVNARVGRIFGGSNEIMKEIIARSL